MPKDLQTRSVANDEMRIRTASVVPYSVNEEARTVDVVLATEDPVVSMTQHTRRGILEVLRMDGVRLPKQIPLLNDHRRHDVREQLGSFRNLRVEGDQLIATMHVSSAEESIWTKIREGHITDVSVGSRPIAEQVVHPGSRRTIGGVDYRSPADRELVINTEWEPAEGSLTWMGADRRTKIRTTESPMNERLRIHLESIGLRSDASEEDAQAFYDGLNDEGRTRADSAFADPATDPPGDPPPPTDPPTDPEAVAHRAVADERVRVRSLHDLAAEDVAPEVLQRAVHEGWSVDRAAPLFLASVRDRAPSGPAIHSHSHDADCNVRSLAAGMLSDYGMDPTEHTLHRGDRNPRRCDQLTEQDADRGDSFRGMSAIDLCRECVRMDGGRTTHNREETIRAAVSGTSLSSVFTTNVYAHLLGGWKTEGDTTQGWVDEEDVVNFLDQEDVTLDIDSKMERLASGDTAKHATASDSSETYRIARYAKQFIVDEQTIINDRFGAIMQMPTEMGENSRKLRPDLIYALMLENPTMTDTGAVFNATVVTTAGGHANLTAAAIGAEGLREAISAMAIQRLGRTDTEPGDPLNIRANYLIAPPQLKWTVLSLLKSGELQKVFADSPDSEFANINLLALEGIKPVFDGRLDDIGVRDPKTKLVRTGSLTNWFLAEGGRRGLRVAYRTGTNRLPSLRSFTLSQGQWGIGWDINMDIGAAFNEYRTWHKSTGSG